MKKTEKTLSIPKSKKIKIFFIAALPQGHFTFHIGNHKNAHTKASTNSYCSAYEYAYWAKDTHMCRMLERYMDEQTKSYTLVRIDAMEETGLAYEQNGAEHRSSHFDLTPLKNALNIKKQVKLIMRSNIGIVSSKI